MFVMFKLLAEKNSEICSSNMAASGFMVVIGETIIYFNQIKPLKLTVEINPNWTVSEEILSVANDYFSSNIDNQYPRKDPITRCFTINLSDKHKLLCKKRNNVFVGVILNDIKTEKVNINYTEFQSEMSFIINAIMTMIFNKFNDRINQIPAFLLQIHCHITFQKEYSKFQTKQRVKSNLSIIHF